ncbi:MAG: peptidoglycan DD-metalloendopeptidase family protein [Ardenticatenaceae bacterium]
MRVGTFFLMMSILLFLGAITTQARSDGAGKANPVGAPDCSEQQKMLTSQGSPSENARLLASTKIPVQLNPSNQKKSESGGGSTVYVVEPGDTLSTIAAQHNTTVYEIIQANNLRNPNVLIKGQRLIIPGKGEVMATEVVQELKRVFPPLYDVWMDGNAVQGETVIIWLRVAPGTSVSGRVNQQMIRFHSSCNLLWGLIAFDALWDNPDIHNLTLRMTAYNNRRSFETIPILLQPGNYWSGSPVAFPAYKQHLQDPELIRSENEKLTRLFSQLPDSSPRWNDLFKLPVDSMLTGPFGARGVVDGKPVGYHEGLDYRCWHGVPFYAPAPGTVVVAEALNVRGTAVYVDHGAGVVSGYFHLSQLNVQVGDQVETGQMLGLCGDSGLTTAPHLHWEMRVNTRWVNPAPWLERTFP